MLNGIIGDPTSTLLRASHPVWQTSFAWIERYAFSQPHGIYDLGQPGWFVNLHSYVTVPEAGCRWENHEATVDLQFAIQGEELIEWSDLASLSGAGEYSVEKDVRFYASASATLGKLRLCPRQYSIFFPGEAHRPKIQIGDQGTELLKLVVKIPFHLLESVTNSCSDNDQP